MSNPSAPRHDPPLPQAFWVWRVGRGGLSSTSAAPDRGRVRGRARRRRRALGTSACASRRCSTARELPSSLQPIYYTHTNTHTHTHTQTHTHARTHTRTHARTNTHAQTSPVGDNAEYDGHVGALHHHVYMYIRICIYTYIIAYIHIYIYYSVHTHTHTHTHKDLPSR